MGLIIFYVRATWQMQLAGEMKFVVLGNGCIRHTLH